MGRCGWPIRHLQTTSSFGYRVCASPDTSSVAAARMRRGKDATAHATPPNDVVVQLQRKRFSRNEPRSRGANATREGAAGQYATPNDIVVRLQFKRLSRYEPRSRGANATREGAATNATPPNDVVVRLQRKRLSRYEPRSCGANATREDAATHATPPNDIVRSLPKGHPFTVNTPVLSLLKIEEPSRRV